jgi:hypothetical protein
MKFKNKNMAMCVLKYLLVVCFSLTAHRLMNVWAWNQLKDEAKTMWNPEQNFFVNAGVQKKATPTMKQQTCVQKK